MIKPVFVVLGALFCFNTWAQEIINLPKSDDSGITWNNPEKEYFSNIWSTQVVTNVSPTYHASLSTKS